MTLDQFIKYTGLVAGSSDVGIFYTFIFCIISYILKGYFLSDEKLIVIIVLLMVKQTLERATTKRTKDLANLNSGKEGDNTS